MTRPTIDPVSGDPIPAVSDNDVCDREPVVFMAQDGDDEPVSAEDIIREIFGDIA